MADGTRWLKLWCSALNDPGLDALDISDFGRWVKLAMLIREQGINGSIDLRPPGRFLQSMFQMDNFQEAIDAIRKFPNCEIIMFQDGVSCNVSLRNWKKYQVDTSTERVRKFRKNETPKKRREEKRREERRGEKNTPLNPPAGKRAITDWFESDFWTNYPRKEERERALNAMLRLKPDAELRKRLCERLQAWTIGSAKWREGYVHLASNWVKHRIFEEEPDGNRNKTGTEANAVRRLNFAGDQEVPGKDAGGADYGRALRERSKKV